MTNINERNNELLEKIWLEKDEKSFIKLFNCNELLIHNYIKNELFIPNDHKHKQIYKEYYNVGRLALVKAIKSFTIEKLKDIEFSNYASLLIEEEILEFMNNECRAKNGTKLVSFEELKEEEYIDKYDPQSILEEIEFQEYKKERIKEAILTLQDKEIEAMQLYYGFKDDNKYTIEEVAKIMGISKSYAEKILISARRKLKVELSDLKTYYREPNKKTKICKLS